MENGTYNIGQPKKQQSLFMPKQKTDELANFGLRLAELRKAAGFTQVELAKELGVTQRVIAYYEGESQHPPANLLPKLALTLGIATDELLGIKPAKKITQQPDTRLMRRFKQIEKMQSKEKRQIIQLLDTFIEHEQLKKKSRSGN